MQAWSDEELADRVYNDEYARVDPDSLGKRAGETADYLRAKGFERSSARLSHLDYGGGNGELSRLLRERGWHSLSYDRFYGGAVLPQNLRFDLVTAIEVIEHATDVHRCVEEMKALLNPDGAIFLSTSLCDGEIHTGQKLTWWYVGPRNGHISIFSRKSLRLLLRQHGLRLLVLENTAFLAFRRKPRWVSLLDHSARTRIRLAITPYPAVLAAVRRLRRLAGRSHG